MELNESQVLTEILKSQFITSSRDKSSFPLTRYKRRTEITSISIDDIILSDVESVTQSHLDILFKVGSSTGNGSYVVSLRLFNLLSILRNMYQSYKSQTNSTVIKRSDLRKMVQVALRLSLNNHDIRINCSCPDFYYRFSYVATINNYNFDQSTAQSIPAVIRNPSNKGSGCKHCIRVLTSTTRWQPKVITYITQLIVMNPKILAGT